MARRGTARFITIVGAAWLLFVAAVYLPDIGRGFVRDDFAWIARGRDALARPANSLLPDQPGFYRPLVTASFAADYLWHGLSARGYGATNLLIFLACVAALWVLCRRLGLSVFAAAVAAFTWSVNPHGINMALVWISGRTSLFVTLFAILAAIATLERRHVSTAVFVAAALASKEEAVVLPFILLTWHVLVLVDERDSRHETAALCAAVTIPAIIYLIARQATPAFTPASAPPFYQFTFDPARVLANAAQYLDRGVTISAAVVLIAGLCFWRRPSLTSGRRRVFAACGFWFAGAYAITVFLPVRSSLYAVFPSVGAAIAAAALVDSIRESADASAARSVAFGAVLAGAILLLVPAYRVRNDRWVEPARLSERALRIIGGDPRLAGSRGSVVLQDVNDPKSSFASAFGTLATDALRLRTGADLHVWIEPPPADWQIARLMPPRRADVIARFAVDRGRVFTIID